MKKLLLFVSMLLASYTSFAQGEGELASSDITILKDLGYRMYIKNYSDLAIEKTKEGKKFAIKYTSSDENIVKPDGNVFRGITPGTCSLTMLVSTVYEGTNDMFDDKNIVMEKTIDVTVSEKDVFTMPTFEISWGLSREEAIANQKSWGHDLITSKYYEHFPNVVEHNPEYIKQLEVFYNNNFEAPITIDQFTEDSDQLIASTILIAAWDRITKPNEYIHAWLKDKGFTDSASESFYWNLELKHDGVITAASWESVVIDNVWYASLMLHYNGVDETGIDTITDDVEKFDISTVGNIIKVNASKFIGRNIILTDVSGKVLNSSKVKNDGNHFEVPGHGMFIIKIDGVKSVKVLL